jgi:hypothetical protein
MAEFAQFLIKQSVSALGIPTNWCPTNIYKFERLSTTAPDAQSYFRFSRVDQGLLRRQTYSSGKRIK